jgi:hypothetical protein
MAGGCYWALSLMKDMDSWIILMVECICALTGYLLGFVCLSGGGSELREYVDNAKRLFKMENG